MDAYIYQYLVGGAIFAIGMLYAWRQGYVGLSGAGLRNAAIMVGGLAIYMIVQGYLQYGSMETAPAAEFTGTYVKKKVLGEKLDYSIMILYFLGILIVGTWFGRNQKTTKDFFFGGQRFSWWLIMFSLVASLIGSYSFVKYAEMGYQYGLSSSMSYLNDWFLIPLMVFGWLPILYFSRVTSIPEYFDRRFGKVARGWATIIILFYLVSYVGVNLFTMGTVLNQLLGWEIWIAAAVVATISAIYVTWGGQTSVIMTDLFQGVMLLIMGLVILVLGAMYLGGWGEFWHHLPREHRLAFPNFNENSSFSGLGVFWQDGVANSAMFYFLNQGIIMRFMAAKSVQDGRKAVIFMTLIMMPLSAIVVSSGGWVARSLVHAGALPELPAKQAFFVATEFLSKPGVFGLVLAALTAALMSTVDTLITAVSAVVVNDVYKPYINPEASEKRLLGVARICAVGVTIAGVAMVPVFEMFGSIYKAHGAVTAAITPPLVVALLFAVFWRRYTRTAAVATMGGGIAMMFVSILFPQIITPFAHGMPMEEMKPGFLAGANVYSFMRAFFGIVVSATIGIVVTLLTKPEPFERQRGLVWGTIKDAVAYYKGSPGRESAHRKSTALPQRVAVEEPARGKAELPAVRINRALARALEASADDLLYISDKRWWLGGLNSVHALIAEVVDDGNEQPSVQIGPETWKMVVKKTRENQSVRVELLY